VFLDQTRRSDSSRRHEVPSNTALARDRRKRTRWWSLPAVVALVLGLTACGDDGTDTTTATDGPATDGPATADDADADAAAGDGAPDEEATAQEEEAAGGDAPAACDLLSVDEVEAAAGYPVELDQSPIEWMCNWDAADRVGGVALTVQPDMLATQDFDSVVDVGAEGAEPVDGIGDAAYRQTQPVDQLMVAHGDALIGVTVSNTDGDPEQVQRDLAQLVIDRL
jgi:hypothetical protein